MNFLEGKAGAEGGRGGGRRELCNHETKLGGFAFSFFSFWLTLFFSKGYIM